MTALVNGRGNLGGALQERIAEFPNNENLYIYHTWNVRNKREGSQEKEFIKFKSFVDNNKNKKIIFISTASKKDTYYVFYKHLAESYLLLNNHNSLVIRLPLLITPNSVFTKFKNNELMPEGFMEFINLKDAVDEILEFISHKGLNRIKEINGNRIKASYIKEILEL